MTSDKTELDSNFEALIERQEATKNLTEKLVKDMESVLVPNTGNRVEDFIFEKIEKKKPQRLSYIEFLGLDMIEAGGNFGSDGAYGSALVKTGQAEQKLGQCERDFIANTGMCYIQPLRKFLDGEMRTITKEKGVLEAKRLDLDAAKSRVRKARSIIGQQAVSYDNVSCLFCLYACTLFYHNKLPSKCFVLLTKCNLSLSIFVSNFSICAAYKF